MIIDTDFVVYVGENYLIFVEKTGQGDEYIAKLYNTGYHHKTPRMFEKMPLGESLERVILMARLWQFDLGNAPYIVAKSNNIMTASLEFWEKFNIPFTCDFREYTIFDFPEVLETWQRENILILGNQFTIYQLKG